MAHRCGVSAARCWRAILLLAVGLIAMTSLPCRSCGTRSASGSASACGFASSISPPRPRRTGRCSPQQCGAELSGLAVRLCRSARHPSGPDCACRGAPPTAWLFAVAVGPQACAELAGLCPARTGVRAGGKAARERAGAVPDRAVFRLRRHACGRARRAAGRIRHAAAELVVGGGYADHDRLRRYRAADRSRPFARRHGDDLRHRHFRIMDRHPGHWLCRRKPPAQFHSDLGPGQQGAVLPVARSVGDHRNHPHAAPRGSARADVAVIRRGKVGDCMYFIADGEVQVDIRRRRFGLAPARFLASWRCSAIRSAPQT